MCMVCVCVAVCGFIGADIMYLYLGARVTDRNEAMIAHLFVFAQDRLKRFVTCSGSLCHMM